MQSQDADAALPTIGRDQLPGVGSPNQLNGGGSPAP